MLSSRRKGVTPALAIILIVGLAAVLVSFAATDFFQLANFADKEPIRASVDHSVLPSEKGTEARVLNYGNADAIYLEPPKGSSKSRIKLDKAGDYGSIEAGDGVYKVVGVLDGSEQVLSTIVLDGPVAFKLTPTSTQGNGNSFRIVAERTAGSKEVTFKEFKISDVGPRGDVGPASNGVYVKSSGGSDGSYSSSVTFGNQYEFDPDPSVGSKGETITIDVKGLSETVDTLSVSPDSTYTDIEVELKGSQTNVKIPLVVDAKVLLKSKSPYDNDISNEPLVIAEKGVVVDANIQGINDGLAANGNLTVSGGVKDIGGKVGLGSNSSVDGNIQNIKADLKAGKNLTTSGGIKEIDGSFSTGFNSSIDGNVEKVKKDVSLGSNTSVSGTVKEVDGSVSGGENLYIDSNVEKVKGDVTTGKNLTVKGDVKEIGGSFNTGLNSSVGGNIQNVGGDVTLGKNSSVSGDVKGITGTVKISDDTYIDGDIENAGKVQGGVNDTITGDLKKIDKSATFGKDLIVDGNIQKIGGDFKAGDNASLSSDVKEVIGNVSIGSKSDIQGNIQDIGGTVTLGQDTRAVGSMDNITKVVLKGDNTVESSITQVSDKIVAYAGTTFKSSIPSSLTVICPDGSSTVTFESGGSCDDSVSPTIDSYSVTKTGNNAKIDYKVSDNKQLDKLEIIVEGTKQDTVSLSGTSSSENNRNVNANTGDSVKIKVYDEAGNTQSKTETVPNNGGGNPSNGGGNPSNGGGNPGNSGGA